MRKLSFVFLAILLVVVAAAAVFFFVGYLKPKGAGLLIETSPAAAVFIDGEQVGRTPYKETRKPEEVVIKLVPDSFDEPLAPFETQATLVSGIETVIRREFGESEDDSSGETLSFEKVGGNESSLSIVSIPDSAQIIIDATTRAFAPYKTSALEPGKHSVLISSPGFIERKLDLRTFKGYKLTVVVKLALSEEPQQEPEEELEEEEEEPKQVIIEITSTPTGFLRVRSEPSTLGKEVDQIEPGEQYVLLAEDEETGWFKIEYEKGEEGWISNQYAKKIDDGESSIEATPSATLTPKPTPT